MGRRHTVLVVEDDQGIRDIVSEVLTDEGFAVVGASNGQEAMALLQGGLAPTIVLLDLMMPGMNGWQVRAAMRDDARLSTIPVIVMTAARASDSVMPTEVVAILKKPIVLDRLLRILHHVAAQAA